MFSNKGRVYIKKCYEIPESARTAKGTNLINLLSLDSEEKITAIVPVSEFTDAENLVLVTKYGVVKRIGLMAYKTKRGVLIPMDQIEWKEGKPYGAEEGGEMEELIEFPAKMSKSLRNVVNPDDIIRDFGADSLRLYEMFMGPLQAVKPWSTKGVEGVHRFLKRANRLVTESNIEDRAMTKAEAKSLNQMIKKVGDDLEAMAFNTAISSMMVYINEAEDFAKKGSVTKEYLKKFVLCLAPFAPHLGEELRRVQLGVHSEVLYTVSHCRKLR
jgi:leucyl-tRNA synthetase